jgi:uncharacterized protein (TIGR02145 family)
MRCKRFLTGLCGLLTLALCACTHTPENCGDGGDQLDPSRQFCRDGKALNKCGGKEYDPYAQFCATEKVYVKCNGKDDYDPLREFCSGAAIYAKCGVSGTDGVTFDPQTQGCYFGIVKSRCGTNFFDPNNEFCFNNIRVYDLCNGNAFDPTKEDCAGESVLPKCGVNNYNPDTHFCDNNAVHAKCGGNDYNPARAFCHSGAIYSKCGEQVYDPAVKMCNGTNIVDIPAVPKYTVYFNTNGGTDGVDPPRPVTEDSGKSITLPGQQTMTNAGYSFGGWNTNIDGTGVTYAGGAPYTVTDNVALYAKWTTVAVSTITDSRDGKIYRTVVIGGQTWMGENLNYQTADSSWCYENDNSKCNTYGRLYAWNATRDVCPSGWHLPSRAEWDQLSDFVNEGGTKQIKWTEGSDTGYYWTQAGKYLKSTSGWYSNNGTDTYGFSALPGGGRSYSGDDGFYSGGYSGYWWTATEDRRGFAYYRTMNNGWDYVIENDYHGVKSNGFSVRCIKGEATPTYVVTVSSVGTNASGNGIYVAGATVSISAGTAPTGQQFKNWMLVDGVTFGNANSASTSFTMPAKAVTVTAVFEQRGGTITDVRDGQTYRTAVIGSQTWMAENLNYATSSGSWCYNNDNSNCNTYGRLYNWSTATDGVSSSDASPIVVRGVCPAGWHLPSNAEWATLVDYVGGSMAAKKLKSVSGWNAYAGVSGNGTDTFGFSALPGGGWFSGSASAPFSSLGEYGDWWTATEFVSSHAYFWNMNYYNDDVSELYNVKSDGYSVRCIKGEATPTYAVTVSSVGTNASGNGIYVAGATVSISAGTAPTGQQFKNWTPVNGVTFGNANSASTSFTMPAKAVTVTAVFEQQVVTGGGTITDVRDGQTYRTVKIGSQTWMAENLNYSTGSSWCYNSADSNCVKYGRLYDWSTARTACPSGWHLPSNAEWNTLVANTTGGSYAGMALKSTIGWYNDGNGTDAYGFSALPGGGRYSGGNFRNAGDFGFWWTATEYGSGDAYRRSMEYDNGYVYGINDDKSYGCSVRCVGD